MYSTSAGQAFRVVARACGLTRIVFCLVEVGLGIATYKWTNGRFELLHLIPAIQTSSALLSPPAVHDCSFRRRCTDRHRIVMHGSAFRVFP